MSSTWKESLYNKYLANIIAKNFLILFKLSFICQLHNIKHHVWTDYHTPKIETRFTIFEALVQKI